MKVVYKYRLSPKVEQDKPDAAVIARLSMPEGARELYVGEQYGSLWVWVLCDPYRTAVDTVFRIIGTGWEIDEHWLDRSRYVGTVQVELGYVWHVFREE